MIDSSVLLGAEKDKAEQEMKEALNFEMKLASMSLKKEEERNQTLTYNPFSLKELTTPPGFPASWLTFFQEYYASNPQLEIDPSERVIINDLAYFKNLSTLLASVDKKVVANYLMWRLTDSTMHFLNKVARDLKETFHMARDGNSEPPKDWKRCLKAVGFDNYDETNFIFAASSMYAKAYFKPEAKEKLEKMVGYLRKAFKQMVEQNDWMDTDTKEEALKKLQKMNQFIAYPDEILSKEHLDRIYDGLEMEQDSYLDNAMKLRGHMENFLSGQLHEPLDPLDWREHKLVAVVNALYNLDLNAMEFPAGFLGDPFYNAEVPMYLNFGAIGLVMGHEITHGFDDQGKQKNSDGMH